MAKVFWTNAIIRGNIIIETTSQYLIVVPELSINLDKLIDITIANNLTKCQSVQIRPNLVVYLRIHDEFYGILLDGT